MDHFNWSPSNPNRSGSMWCPDADGERAQLLKERSTNSRFNTITSLAVSASTAAAFPETPSMP